MSSPEFRTDFSPEHGKAIELAPGLSRIVCNNGGPFTFHGTNTYLLGEERVAVVDPGPLDEQHLAAVAKAIGGRPVSHIIVTHTHMDHSPLAKTLQKLCGAPILAEGPHRPSRELNMGEINPLDASGDKDFVPDQKLGHGETIDGDSWTLTSLSTPGHTANHMAFAWNGTDYLFSGDHVMAWATSIVAPPDGSMVDYMSSLEVLLAQKQTIYFPGHGGRLERAHKFVRALRTHRRMREHAILDQVRSGTKSISSMVAKIYQNIDPKLHNAAALSVMAHLEDLVSQGKIETADPPSMDGAYFANNKD